MTDQAFDELVRRVMLDGYHQEYGSLMEELPEHDFSPEFEKRMRKMLHRADHPIRHWMAQAAACLLLAALLSGCSVLAFVPEARAAFAGWIRELGQEWFSYHYDGAAAVTPKNTVYYPAWLPEGYQEVTAPEPGTFVHALYENESGFMLSFTYQIGLKRITFHVEWVDAEVRQTTVADASAEFYLNTAGGNNVLVWTDETAGIVFWIAAPLTEEELVRVAESVRESEPMGWVYRPTWFPMGSWIVLSVEQDGERDTLWETGEGIPFEFFYSKSGVTPYGDRTDGQSVVIGENSGMLYPSEASGAGQVLTWDDPDTGYALWLVSEIPVEDMLQFAESVEIYSSNMSGAFDIDVADGMEDDPLCDEVERALTEEFVAEVRAYARRDAEVNVYMQSGYRELVRAYMAEYLSPERDAAEARVSDLMESISPADGWNSEHIVCLVGPLYCANIYAGIHSTTAHIYNENGVMIAAYNAQGWFDVATYAEMQFNYTVTQIYAEAYRAVREELDGQS